MGTDGHSQTAVETGSNGAEAHTTQKEHMHHTYPAYNISQPSMQNETLKVNSTVTLMSTSCPASKSTGFVSRTATIGSMTTESVLETISKPGETVAVIRHSESETKSNSEMVLGDNSSQGDFDSARASPEASVTASGYTQVPGSTHTVIVGESAPPSPSQSKYEVPEHGAPASAHVAISNAVQASSGPGATGSNIPSGSEAGAPTVPSHAQESSEMTIAAGPTVAYGVKGGQTSAPEALTQATPGFLEESSVAPAGSIGSTIAGSEFAVSTAAVSASTPPASTVEELLAPSMVSAKPIATGSEASPAGTVPSLFVPTAPAEGSKSLNGPAAQSSEAQAVAAMPGGGVVPSALGTAPGQPVLEASDHQLFVPALQTIGQSGATASPSSASVTGVIRGTTSIAGPGETLKPTGYRGSAPDSSVASKDVVVAVLSVIAISMFF